MTGIINTPLLLSPEGYQISRSVRLRSNVSAYFNRTPASAGNRTTWTWSGWVKRGKLGAGQGILGVQTNIAANPYSRITIGATDAISILENNGSGVTLYALTTNRVLRDASAWYHFVYVYDSTNATSTDRLRLYINGVRETSFSTATYPSLNQVSLFNSATVHQLGRLASNDTTFLFDGYFTEINFIDGQALTSSSFGEFNPVTGVWQPKKYTGTYGTNGYYLNFSDNSAATAAAIGKDYSGNGNNWTPNNISETIDSMLDVPTMWDDGSNGRGNYATLNPISTITTGTLLGANLTMNTGTVGHSAISTIGMSSGKWYWEVSTSGGTTETRAGVYGTAASTLYSFAANATYGFRFDASAGTLDYTANGSTWTSLATGLTSGPYFPYINNNGTTAKNITVVFGQRPFTYTPPTGYKALHTGNLPDATIKKGANYMAAATYTGNGGTDTPRSVGFKPDFLWVKQRSNNVAGDHILVDVMRLNASPNYPLELYSNLTLAEFNGGRVSAYSNWPSDGFAVNNDARTNANGSTYVAWSWKANGAPVSNTTGSITSQVSAGALQGISIATYTGTGANATVGHGLGVAPKMIIVKNRTGANNWAVYHANLTSAAYYLSLNQTIAQTSNNTLWNSTAPTSSVFSVGTAGDTNGNTNNLVAYAFSEIAGFSKFGSYTGNGSANGPFVYLGFRPKFVMVKRTDVAGNWIIEDSARDPFNVVALALLPNTAGAELTQTSTNSIIDFVSNGFKLRGTGADSNASAGTYIYMAFAENPFKNSLAR